MFRLCQVMSTSMSVEQASSGPRRRISTVSPFLRGDTRFATMHFAWNGKRILFPGSNTNSSLSLPIHRRPRWLRYGCDLHGSGLWSAFSLFCSRIRRTDVQSPGELGFATPVAIEFPALMPSTSRGSERWGISARVPARDLICWLLHNVLSLSHL
jgi:hypothetical protein